MKAKSIDASSSDAEREVGPKCPPPSVTSTTTTGGESTSPPLFASSASLIRRPFAWLLVYLCLRRAAYFKGPETGTLRSVISVVILTEGNEDEEDEEEGEDEEDEEDEEADVIVVV